MTDRVRDFSKALLRFSWAVPLLGLQQLRNLFNPRDFSRSADMTVEALNAFSEVADNQFTDWIRTMYRSGDQLQARVMDQLSGANIGVDSIQPFTGSDSVNDVDRQMVIPLKQSGSLIPRSQDLVESQRIMDDSFDSTFTHHTTVVNNVRLHYVTGGTGKPMVLLHGYAETWYEWRRIMPALARHYTLIVPDLRGAGDSDKPVGGYNKMTMAEDIHDLVRSLGYRKINLVGHDIGTMVAYAYAATYPDEVNRLVVMEALIPGVRPWDEALRSGRFWHFAFHGVPNLPEALVQGRERMYLTHGFYKPFAYNPAALLESDIDEYVRHYAAPGGMRAGFEWFRAFSRDSEDGKRLGAKKLPMPVLAVAGDHSLGESIEASMRGVAENVRGVVVPQCGHWIVHERTQFLKDLLLGFFSD